MKKHVLFLVITFFSISTIWASGGKCGANTRWYLSSDGVLTVSGQGETKKFGSELPFRPSDVRKVIVEHGVTSIGKNMFKNCKNLRSIYIPESLITIGESAFENCKMLGYLELPSSVRFIEKRAFKGCKGLISVDIPVGCVSIGEYAFQDCEQLSDLRISNTVSTIGNGAFSGCYSIQNIIELPEIITKNDSPKYGLDYQLTAQYWQGSDKNKKHKKEKSIDSSLLASEVKVEIIKSDVDVYVPQNISNNNNTHVVIISNENYTELADVMFAEKDGAVFAEYCEKTLSIPHKNISIYKNATYGNMLGAILKLKELSIAYKQAGQKIDIIFYYCGHGAPDERTKEAYLIPSDAFMITKDVCLPLERLYRELGDLDVNSVTVFLDACFSGATRDGEMLASVRGIAQAPRQAVPTGNVAVITASSGDQSAAQYDDKGHGLFTYFLLKKLQETKGEVTLGELYEYLSQRVNVNSLRENNKQQSPSAIVSPLVKDEWKNWKLVNNK